EPAVVASVPMPRAAPKPKQGEASASQPTTIAGLISNIFGGSKAEAAPSAPSPEKEQVAARGTNTDLAAKPKQVAPVRAASAATSAPVHTASTPASSATKPHDAAPKGVAEPARAPAWPSPTQTAKAEPPAAPQPELRTAYSTPPASNNGLL